MFRISAGRDVTLTSAVLPSAGSAAILWNRMKAGYASLLAFFLTLEISGAGRPNILFIMTDDHAAHAVSAYGSKINQTPNLDRIGREGMRFSYCFVVNSLCTHSRAAILTG